MRRAFLNLTLITILIVTAVSAQAKTNFSGKWALADPNAAGDMMTPASMTVTQDEKTLKSKTSSQMGEFETVFNLDGTEAKSPIEAQGTTIERTTKAAWDGAKLVMTTAANFQGQSFETKQTWTLNADGTLTVDSTRPDFQGGGAPITSKASYKKQ